MVSSEEGEKIVLFVCSYNILRSPTAEFIFNQKAQDAGLNMRARSAGTLAVDGKSSSFRMMDALRRAGYRQVEPTISHRINEELLKSASLVLGMEECHLERIRRDFQGLNLTSLDTLAGYVGEKGGVEDPESIIRNNPLSWTLRGLPYRTYPLKKAVGGIHPADYDGVYRVFNETVAHLERLIDPLINKLSHPSAT